jgi:hypothetical protein
MPSYRPDRGGGGFTPIPLTYAASMTLDLSAAAKPLFLITLTGAVTIQAINGQPWQEFAVQFTQGGSGGNGVTWDSTFRGSNDTPLPATSSALGADDYFGFIVNPTRGKFDHLAPNKGF